MDALYRGNLKIQNSSSSQRCKIGLVSLGILACVSATQIPKIYNNLQTWAGNTLQELKIEGSERVQPYVKSITYVEAVPFRGAEYYANQLMPHAPKDVRKSDLVDWISIKNGDIIQAHKKVILPEF